jgi:hypothetical protein
MYAANLHKVISTSSNTLLFIDYPFTSLLCIVGFFSFFLRNITPSQAVGYLFVVLLVVYFEERGLNRRFQQNNTLFNKKREDYYRTHQDIVGDFISLLRPLTSPTFTVRKAKFSQEHLMDLCEKSRENVINNILCPIIEANDSRFFSFITLPRERYVKFFGSSQWNINIRLAFERCPQAYIDVFQELEESSQREGLIPLLLRELGVLIKNSGAFGAENFDARVRQLLDFYRTDGEGYSILDEERKRYLPLPQPTLPKPVPTQKSSKETSIQYAVNIPSDTEYDDVYRAIQVHMSRFEPTYERHKLETYLGLFNAHLVEPDTKQGFLSIQFQLDGKQLGSHSYMRTRVRADKECKTWVCEPPYNGHPGKKKSKEKSGG